MAKKDETYPSYFKSKGSVCAVTSATDCYVISNWGSNMNDGVCLDYYKTRRMVLKHYCGERITRAEFAEFYNKLYQAYLQRML